MIVSYHTQNDRLYLRHFRIKSLSSLISTALGAPHRHTIHTLGNPMRMCLEMSKGAEIAGWYYVTRTTVHPGTIQSLKGCLSNLTIFGKASVERPVDVALVFVLCSRQWFLTRARQPRAKATRKKFHESQHLFLHKANITKLSSCLITKASNTIL